MFVVTIATLVMTRTRNNNAHADEDDVRDDTEMKNQDSPVNGAARTSGSNVTTPTLDEMKTAPAFVQTVLRKQ